MISSSARLILLAAAAVLASKTCAQSASQSLTDIAVQTPGIRASGSSQLSGINLNIRGQQAVGEDGSGGVIVDGIPISDPAILASMIADLDGVKILKGPQGQGASAAAFIVTTRKPGDTFSGTARASIGGNRSFALQGAVDGPLARDRVFFGMTVTARTTDGFYRNTFLNSNTVDDATDYDLGGRILFKPNDGSALDVKVHLGQTKAADSAFNAAFGLPTFAKFLNRPLFNENINSHSFAFQNNIPPTHRQRAVDVSTKWDQDLNWAHLTGWIRYGDVNNDLVMDGFSGIFGTFNAEPYCRASTAKQFAAGQVLAQPQNMGATPESSLFGISTSTGCDGSHFQRRDQKDLATEFRLSSLSGSAFEWSVGGSFQNIYREAGVNVGIDKGIGVVRQLSASSAGTNPTEQLFADVFRTDGFAGFGAMAYRIFSGLEATMAMRYEAERHRVHNRVPTGTLTTYVTYGLGAPFTGGAPLNPALDTAFNATGAIPDQRETFSQVIPRLGLTWTGIENFELYADWGVGFKSGGFNNLGTASAVNLFINNSLNAGLGINDRFAKERDSAFEGGFRTKFFSGRITLSGLGYFTLAKGMQFAELVAGPFGVLRAVNTIDQVRIAGGETEASVQVTHGFSVYAGATAQSSKILAMSSRPDAVGNKAPAAPDYTINGGAEFLIPLTSAISLFSRSTLNVTGPTVFHVIQCQNRPTVFGVSGNTCGAGRNAFATVELRVGVQTDIWSMAVYVKNLTNDRHVDEIIVVPELGLSLLKPGGLRRIGLELATNF